MKVGDYVGWADHEDDDLHFMPPAGIVLEIEEDPLYRDSRHHGYTRFLILMQHNGELSWEFGSDLVVIYESR